MDNLNKVGFIEAIALSLIIVVNRLSVNMPQNIVLSCGSSAVLNAIFISIIAILFVMLLTKLFKRFPEYDIIDIADFTGGRFLKNIISIILFIYIYFFRCFNFIKRFCRNHKNTLLHRYANYLSITIFRWCMFGFKLFWWS